MLRSLTHPELIDQLQRADGGSERLPGSPLPGIAVQLPEPPICTPKLSFATIGTEQRLRVARKLGDLSADLGKARQSRYYDDVRGARTALAIEKLLRYISGYPRPLAEWCLLESNLADRLAFETPETRYCARCATFPAPSNSSICDNCVVADEMRLAYAK